MNLLTLIFWFLAVFFTFVNVIRTVRGLGVSGANILWMTIGIVGLIYHYLGR